MPKWTEAQELHIDDQIASIQGDRYKDGYITKIDLNQEKGWVWVYVVDEVHNRYHKWYRLTPTEEVQIVSDYDLMVIEELLHTNPWDSGQKPVETTKAEEMMLRYVAGDDLH